VDTYRRNIRLAAVTHLCLWLQGQGFIRVRLEGQQIMSHFNTEEEYRFK